MNGLEDVAKLLGGEDATPEPVQSESAQTTEEVEPVAEDTPESSPEVVEEEEAEEVPLAAAEDTPEEPEAYFPETLDDLIDAYDGNADKLKEITVATKRNGERVSLNHVLQNWENSEAAVRKSQEASEMKKALEAEQTRWNDSAAKKWEEIEGIADALEQLYLDTGKAELELLKDDPAEYAAKKVDLADRAAQLEKVKRGLTEKKQAQFEESDKQRQQKQHEWEIEQFHIQQQLIPEWADEKTANEEFGYIREYSLNLGFTDDELRGITNARSRKILRDAALYNQMKNTASPKLKRVVQKPKKAVKGKGQPPAAAQKDALNKRVRAAAQSKNKGQKAAAIAEILGTLGR